MEANTQSAASSLKSEGTVIQLVVFSLDTEKYAIPIHDVSEVVKTPEITPVPNSSSFVLGIINLRGNIVPVFDLQKIFSLQNVNQNKVKKHIVVTQTKSPFGILVDKVIEVVDVSENEIQETPEVMSHKISKDYVQGVVIVNTDKIENNEVVVAQNNQNTQNTQKTESLSVVHPNTNVGQHPAQNTNTESNGAPQANNNQEALFILRVSKIGTAKDLAVNEAIDDSSIAKTNENEVQTIKTSSSYGESSAPEKVGQNNSEPQVQNQVQQQDSSAKVEEQIREINKEGQNEQS